MSYDNGSNGYGLGSNGKFFSFSKGSRLSKRHVMTCHQSEVASGHDHIMISLVPQSVKVWSQVSLNPICLAGVRV